MSHSHPPACTLTALDKKANRSHVNGDKTPEPPMGGGEEARVLRVLLTIWFFSIHRTVLPGSKVQSIGAQCTLTNFPMTSENIID